MLEEVFFILSLPRCGGHLLGEDLGQLPGLRFIGEAFHHFHQPRRYQSLLAGDIDGACVNFRPGDVVLLHPQVRPGEYGLEMEELIPKGFLECLNRRQTIVLFRSDLLAQLVSFKGAMKTGIWGLQAKDRRAADQMIYGKSKGLWEGESEVIEISLQRNETVDFLTQGGQFASRVAPYSSQAPLVMEDYLLDRVGHLQRICMEWSLGKIHETPEELVRPLSDRITYKLGNREQVEQWLKAEGLEPMLAGSARL